MTAGAHLTAAPSARARGRPGAPRWDRAGASFVTGAGLDALLRRSKVHPRVPSRTNSRLFRS